MEEMIYNPLKEYVDKFKQKHLDNTKKFLEKLVQESKINIEENRKTVQEYNTYKENLRKLKRKLNWLKFLRVLMCLTLVLIPLVILKTTPKIKELKQTIEEADKKIQELLELAHRQMRPLNELFRDRDSLDIIEETMPHVDFEMRLSIEQEKDMKTNYDFDSVIDNEESTLDMLAGRYNGNPFVFENRLVHRMGTETYHGSLTISWTERYRDSNGKMQTRRRTETLHASVTKPKPFYNNQVVLHYGAQGAPELTFTRDATNLDEKSERAIERYVKRGERRLGRKTKKALAQNENFMSMANTEFEVLFDALDRNHEVQFRTLFTPLAQTNMVDLILSKEGYGDDFNFFKRKRMNRIVSNHSQGRPLYLTPQEYISYSYDEIHDNFINKNVKYFKDVYFDFAPILAIPLYQERPIHSLDPLPDYRQLYARKEYESIANIMKASHAVHPKTKTKAILKAAHVVSKDTADEIRISAYSYDIEQQVDYVAVRGGDGFMHNVPVKWDLYIPLENHKYFYVANEDDAKQSGILARRRGLCIYNK